MLVASSHPAIISLNQTHGKKQTSKQQQQKTVFKNESVILYEINFSQLRRKVQILCK